MLRKIFLFLLELNKAIFVFICLICTPVDSSSMTKVAKLFPWDTVKTSQFIFIFYFTVLLKINKLGFVKLTTKFEILKYVNVYLVFWFQ